MGLGGDIVFDCYLGRACTCAHTHIEFVVVVVQNSQLNRPLQELFTNDRLQTAGYTSTAGTYCTHKCSLNPEKTPLQSLSDCMLPLPVITDEQTHLFNVTLTH